MMKERLDDIRERVRLATAEPWAWFDTYGPLDDGFMRSSYLGDRDYNTRVIRSQMESGDITASSSDMELIAHARSDIPYLLARLEKAEEALQEVGHADSCLWPFGRPHTDGNECNCWMVDVKAYFAEKEKPNVEPDQ